MRATITALLIFFSSPALANSQLCANNILQHDICADAKRIAAEEQKSLPYKMSERVQVVSFTADANVLSQGIKLLYDRTFFENGIIQQGRSIEDMKRKMFENSTEIACGGEISRAFLSMGGHMRFLYEFANGEILFEFYVSTC